MITNKPGDIARRLLQDLSLANRFVAIIGDGDGFPRKPDPGAALALIAGAGTQPARTAVVGDGLPRRSPGARYLGARAISPPGRYARPPIAARRRRSPTRSPAPRKKPPCLALACLRVSPAPRRCPGA